MMLMQKAKDPKFWEQVRLDPAYSEMVDTLKGYYRNSYMEEIPVLKYSDRMRFYGDGDRHEFERPYFRRRTFLASAALLALIYPEEQHYLDEVHQVLWAICDEYTWALPAHTNATLEDDLTNVDLFNAETGFAVAELCYLLEDRLDKLVLERARMEARKRVIGNYLNRKQGWESNTNNWAAVCAGNIGGAMMYLEPERFKEQLPRLLDTMKCFMSGFPQDGTCMEGFGYWHYGFGNYVWFADLLLQFTDGEMDLFKWDKVEAISGYAQRSFLRGGATVSYSDGSRDGKASRPMVHYLHRLFPDSVQLLPDNYTVFDKGNVTWMQTFRNLLYVDYHVEKPEFALKNYDLPGAGQVFINNENYSLAVKAGDNDEPHNHNDVGNFILATDKGQIFCDLGSGRYTRQYFRPETRYSILCNSSRGHSVPIVNGKEQIEGKEYSGTISREGNVITVEMSGAYGQPGFEKLTRTFTYDDSKIVLTDAFAPDYESMTERFMTLIRPEIFEDHLIVDGVKLVFDPNLVTLHVQEEQHARHVATGNDWNIPCYCIDFELKPGLDKVSFTMNVEE